MQSAWHGQHKLSDTGLKGLTIIASTQVAAMHAANGCSERTAAGVFKGLARRKQRLLADHTQASHILTLVVAIHNNPVTANDLRWLLPSVGDAHGIGEKVLLLRWVGLLGQKLRLHLNSNLVRFHAGFS
jgi:hypothetical protein